MNDKIKKMSTLIMGAITSLNSSSDEVIKSPEQETDPFASVKVGALNFNIPQYIAAHSSHSSHSSHRSSSGSSSGHSSHSSHSSHRSSSSSGSYTPPTPAPAPTYRTSTPATTNSIRQSDPLGRPNSPAGTYEDKSDHSLSVIHLKVFTEESIVYLGISNLFFGPERDQTIKLLLPVGSRRKSLSLIVPTSISLLILFSVATPLNGLAVREKQNNWPVSLSY